MMRPSFIIGSIVAMEACKGLLLILLGPYYPNDLAHWIRTLYPPWQTLQTPAPYGLPWYALYAPGLFGLPALAAYQATAEGLALLYLIKRKEPYIAGAFAITSLLIFFWDPFDLWSYLFILLSQKWRPLLLTSILVKIPLGAPSWVWQFILTASLRTAGNWPHYIILSVWWLGMLWYVSGLAAHFNLTPNVVGQLITRIASRVFLNAPDPRVVQRMPSLGDLMALRPFAR